MSVLLEIHWFFIKILWARYDPISQIINQNANWCERQNQTSNSGLQDLELNVPGPPKTWQRVPCWRACVNHGVHCLACTSCSSPPHPWCSSFILPCTSSGTLKPHTGLTFLGSFPAGPGWIPLLCPSTYSATLSCSTKDAEHRERGSHSVNVEIRRLLI